MARRSRGTLTHETPHSPLADEDLAAAAADGSREAFALLVDRYGGRVAAVLERKLGDHHAALDLSQDVWLRVFQKLGTFDREHSFRSWLFAIALNAGRDERRRRLRTKLAYVDETCIAALGREHGPHEPSDIDRALQRVHEPFRSALILVDVEGLDYDEAARCLGCALGTIKSRVARGRAAFREHWTRPTETHPKFAGLRTRIP